MRRINLREVAGEPRLARPLVDERGAYVLASGRPLTGSLAQRLWDRGFRHAYVETPGFEDVAANEPLRSDTYTRLRRLLGDVVRAVQQTRPGDTPELPVDEIGETVREACDQLEALSVGDPFLLYPPWASRLDEWISFAINGAVLAGLVGLREGVQGARHLFTAALVQDVGLWRADRLQDHVSATIDLLRPVRSLSPIVKAIAAEHHELLDGSGYPAGKSGDELHSLTPVMAVVVAYLTMIGSATKPMLPHEALEGLLAGADTLYSGDVVNRFRHILHTYPPGTVVRLTNGRRGVVLEPGPAGLHRPKIRLLPTSVGRIGTVDEHSEGETEYPIVDLTSELSLMIDRVLS